MTQQQMLTALVDAEAILEDCARGLVHEEDYEDAGNCGMSSEHYPTHYACAACTLWTGLRSLQRQRADVLGVSFAEVLVQDLCSVNGVRSCLVARLSEVA